MQEQRTRVCVEVEGRGNQAQRWGPADVWTQGQRSAFLTPEGSGQRLLSRRKQDCGPELSHSS